MLTEQRWVFYARSGVPLSPAIFLPRTHNAGAPKKIKRCEGKMSQKIRDIVAWVKYGATMVAVYRP
ncbi:hypothetical protein [Microbulbifer halophilus]|uniref:Uncharacterized protein n=1 Tax=Microbulbifer halophilus TaxID=453963 RepID=A0ABW5EB38_9GAMM|nr:hypothetical protein [Microbulbifer halophilus]MCW8128282.1 hypothetical protein [Microbulbifer halophilus]